MTIAPEHLADNDVTPPAAPADGQVASELDDQAGPGHEQGPDREPEPLRIEVVATAALLATGAGAWMAGGLIRGWMPVLVALLGVAVGVGVTFGALRLRRPSLQYAVLPLAALVGAVLTTPEATGGTANLPGLVDEAIRGGGLAQPPIPFNPGWRFILVTLFAIIGAGATSAAMTFTRPRLAVIIPLPVVFGAALIQPAGSEVLTSAVGIALVIGALAVAYGANRSAEDTRALARSFELRRLLRGGGMLAVVMVGIVLVAQTGFLFPEVEQDRIIPPRKPPPASIEEDRELFRVLDEFNGPIRLGVLDEYDGTGWLLPSRDPSRVTKLPDGRLDTSLIPSELVDAERVPVTFEIVDMAGLGLPVPGPLLGVADADVPVELDPRTGIPRLERRLPQGLTYTALTVPVPTAAQLNATASPPPELTDKFIEMPPPVGEVFTLLDEAPTEPFTRLQFLRERLYETVVLSGGGGAVDVSPRRAVELLEDGTKATPFEVVATEAMLARWAGVPARVGYGYFGGDEIEGGTSFRPRHGRAWLEAYFEGFGWVPLVGQPPRAASSLSEEAKLDDANVQATDDVALVVYLPVERTSVAQLFEIVRYWLLVVAAPAGLALALLLISYPILLKVIRSSRRRRWGVARGPAARALVAYAELRDRCHDLNVGDVSDYPLEFVERFVDDDEHEELAWAVTRALWGDLRRDVRDEDAAAVTEMARSVRRRIVSAQPAVNRFLAAISRASLRDPYNEGIPNLYPRPWRRWRSVLSRSGLPWPRRLRRRVSVTTAVMLVAISSCAGVEGSAPAPAATAAELPSRIVPRELNGARFTREPVAERAYEDLGDEVMVSDGVVYTIQEERAIQGALQVAAFRPAVDPHERHVQAMIEAGIGGAFESLRFGTIRVRRAQRGDQLLYLWFPPEHEVMVLIVLREETDRPDDLARSIVAYVRGFDDGDVPTIRRARGA